ncbi:hypothetical protein HXX01_01400, partial [Candidatus Nomurabacteria bacterium]|nr:hypothetical protein [Candidatus Nomurabacteria bacterium]
MKIPFQIFLFFLSTIVLFNKINAQEIQNKIVDTISRATRDNGIGITLIVDPVHSYLYKGERKNILEYRTGGYSDNNGDTIATALSRIDINVDAKQLHWCSLLPFNALNYQNIQTERVLAPFQTSTIGSNNAYITKVFADASNLTIGQTYLLNFSSCNEATSGPISIAFCVGSNNRNVHVIPYPINQLSSVSFDGSYSKVFFTWNQPEIRFWKLDHYSIFCNDTDSIRIEELFKSRSEINVINSDTSVLISDACREINPYYAVVGYDSLGEAIAISQSCKVTSNNSSFSLLSPQDGSVLENLYPDLYWEEVPGATYDLWISEDSAFNQKTVIHGITSNTYHCSLSLSDHKNYFWKVFTNSGQVSNQTGWMFSLNQHNLMPGDFSLILPENNAIIDSKRPIFRWNCSQDSGDNISYKLIIGIDTISTTHNYYMYNQELSDDQTYSWKVIALDSKGVMKQSSTINTFSIDYNDLPEGFEILEPIFNWGGGIVTETSLNPTFKWSSSHTTDPGGSITYTLFYSTDSTFQNKIQIDGIVDTTYTPQVALEEDKFYYWKVKATTDRGRFRWNFGLINVFVTNSYDRNPSGAIQIYPENNRTISPGTFDLSWYKPEDDLYDFHIYRVSYSRDSTFTNKTVIDNILGNERVNVSLQDTGAYYWYVETRSKRVPNENRLAVDGGYSIGPVIKFNLSNSYITGIAIPNGGERWKVGSTRSIVWNSSNVDTVNLEYSFDGGTSWHSISDHVPGNLGNYNWIIPNTISDSCLIKISSKKNPTTYSYSNNYFGIVKYPIWYVSKSGNDQTGDGTKDFPFSTIQKTINTCGADDSIKVAGGRYFESIHFPNYSFGCYLIGGYDPVTWQRDVSENKTIIDASGANGITIPSNIDISSMVIDGFTFKHANYAFYKSDFPSIYGGYIRNCIIDSCTNVGMIAFVGSIFIENSLFSNCQNGFVFHQPLNINFTNCIFNKIAGYALYSYRYSSHIVHIHNCVFNSCSNGVLIYDPGTGSHIISNSIFMSCGTAISYDNCPNISINNNDFFNNGNNFSSCSDNGSNIFNDPLFVDPSAGNFILRNDSPCISAGSLQYCPSYDFLNNPRPSPANSNPDIGAFESLLGQSRVISFRIFPEGLYSANGMLNKAKNETAAVYPGDISDKVTIEIREPVQPYTIVFSSANEFIHTDGTITLSIYPSIIGNYYVVVKHRNSIETWSSVPVNFSGGTIMYDFTDDISKAFGNNLKLINGKYCIYGGDVNQDGLIDYDDIIPVDNESYTGTEGYLPEDINGDGQINPDDLLIIYDNSRNFISSIHPILQQIPTVNTSVISNLTQSTATCGGNVILPGIFVVSAKGVCWSTTPNPTLDNQHTTDGAGTGVFISSITGLNANTTYYVRAYATNSAGTAYGNEISFISLSNGAPCPGTPTMVYGGHTYNTVQIGPQCWLKENLNLGTRINGSQNQTNDNQIEKYCYNDLESNCDIYGGLYQWNEMMQYS